MAGGVAFDFLGKLSEFLVAPIVRHITYPFCYNNNIKALRDQVKALENMREDLQLSIDAARRNLEVTGRDAKAWLTEVDNIKNVAGRFLEGSDQVKKGCINGWNPKNLKNRYSLSRQATKQTLVVMKLQENGNKFTKLTYPAPPSGTSSTSTHVSKGYESRMSIIKEVITALKDDQINMIGICGMAGVGKTTMANEICEKVRAENLFDEVAMAVVSRDPDLINIQDQLAEMFGLTLEAKTNIVARANKLRKRILQDDRRTLIVLDDVWEGSLDLGGIGLPARGKSKTCKILITSRIERVCIEMESQRISKVQVLSDLEAWHLFKEAAGNCVENTEIKLTAERVAKECGGLPLAILTVGKALNGKKEHVWNDALEQLRKSNVTHITGWHKLVYSRIEFSYNHLEGDQVKSLLLLCCLFPEDYDIPVEYLVRYGVGLRLFKDVEPLAATRDRVDSLVDELRSCYLLLSGDEQTVKLHDVVRDVGLSIASRTHSYMVRHDTRLNEWPQDDGKQPQTAISLSSDEMKQLPTGLDCPNLTLLQLVCRFPSLKIPGEFFADMKGLRVVSFKDMLFESPPPSLQFLMNLRTLCLDFCKLGTDISLIGSQRKLEILSFYGSSLHELPREIRQLSYLKLLDLRCDFESGPKMIPSGVLSGLNKLEELYMGDYFQPWDDNDRDEGYSESITDINSLPHLSTLQIRVMDSMLLLQLDEFCFEKLKRFHITRSGQRMKPDNNTYRFRRSLEIEDVDAKWVIGTQMNLLLKRTEDLFLKVKDLKNLFKECNEDGFVNLKTLVLVCCEATEYLIDVSCAVAVKSAFINLEFLTIESMDNLKEICHGNLPAKSFGRLEKISLKSLSVMKHLWKGPITPPSLCNLRVLKMKDCNAIKGIFPESVVKCLVQLQELTIERCEMVEEIVFKEGGPQVKDDEIIEFPKLNELRLRWLPRLTSFDPKRNVFARPMQPFFNQQVLLPGMDRLSVFGVGEIVQIVGGQIQAGSLHKLRVMIVLNCQSLESVFDFEGLTVGRKNEQVMLDQLESMRLMLLPQLTHIWRMVPNGIQGFRNLTSLQVEGCGSLRYLFSHSMAKMLVSLQDLRLRWCENVEEVVESDTKQAGRVKRMDKVKTILFPQLSSLHLENLKNLRIICPDDLELASLKNVFIKNCPKLKTRFEKIQGLESISSRNYT